MPGYYGDLDDPGGGVSIYSGHFSVGGVEDLASVFSLADTDNCFVVGRERHYENPQISI